MEEFRIDKNPKSSVVLVVILMIASFSGFFSIFFIGIYGLIFAVGAILACIVYIIIIIGILEKKVLVIDDNGLRFYRGDDLELEIEWGNVKRIESFDQAHHDFVFQAYVEKGLHFIPDPYDFHADDMRDAFKKVKEATKGMDIEFIEHDVRFA